MSSTKKRKKTNDPTELPFWVWPFLFLTLWQVLLWAQNPGLMSDDSGEIVASSYRLGLPHPPGYPLLNFLGRLASLLPVGSIAFRLNLFSTALMLLALWFILDTCRSLFRQVFAHRVNHRVRAPETLLVVLALVFIFCRSVFAQCLTAKGCIYALTLLLGSLILWFWIKWESGKKGDGIFGLACLLWSIGMANHWQTQVLWLPFLVWWGCRAKFYQSFKGILLGLASFDLGFSLYLYLPLRAALGANPCWGNPINLKGFYWVVTRQLVAGSEKWLNNFSFYFETFREFLKIATTYWLPGFAFLVVTGAYYLWRQNRNLFLGLLLFTFPVGTAVFFIHQQHNLYLLHTYLISLAGIGILFGFMGMVWLDSIFQGERIRQVFPIFLTFFAVGWGVHIFKVEDKSEYTLA
ncbi:MAG TPA: DUF2723 domain-containing protein, partial [bacterium]